MPWGRGQKVKIGEADKKAQNPSYKLVTEMKVQ